MNRYYYPQWYELAASYGWGRNPNRGNGADLDTLERRLRYLQLQDQLSRCGNNRPGGGAPWDTDMTGRPRFHQCPGARAAYFGDNNVVIVPTIPQHLPGHHHGFCALCGGDYGQGGCPVMGGRNFARGPQVAMNAGGCHCRNCQHVQFNWL